jgi:hypothetical protein
VTNRRVRQLLRKEVEDTVRSAFAGTRLGHGVSLSIAELIDDWADPATVEALLGTEPDEAWTSIPVDELDRTENIAHLDAEGLRYYIPALMLRLLDDYQPTEMRSIGTIAALDQRSRHPLGFLELLTASQRRAIAIYVRALPDLVELRYEDSSRMSRAFEDVWSRELRAEP